jgi:hypothetical protein
MAVRVLGAARSSSATSSTVGVMSSTGIIALGITAMLQGTAAARRFEIGRIVGSAAARCDGTEAEWS